MQNNNEAGSTPVTGLSITKLGACTSLPSLNDTEGVYANWIGLDPETTNPNFSIEVMTILNTDDVSGIAVTRDSVPEVLEVGNGSGVNEITQIYSIDYTLVANETNLFYITFDGPDAATLEGLMEEGDPFMPLVKMKLVEENANTGEKKERKVKSSPVAAIKGEGS